MDVHDAIFISNENKKKNLMKVNLIIIPLLKLNIGCLFEMYRLLSYIV